MKVDRVYIEITNRCNLNCRDCYNASGLNRETIEIGTETLLHTIESLYNRYKITSFDISGGEPLLHSQWNKILDITERLSHLSFFFVTNGTIRDDRFYKLLEKNKRIRVQFSIDGINEETHSKIRGAGQFKKAIENLSSFNAANRPVIKMVLSRNNYNLIEEYFKLAIEYNCVPAFSFAEKLGNANANWQELKLDDNEKITVIKTIIAMSKKYKINLLPPFASLDCPIIKGEDISLCIKSNGNILPCQNLYDDRFSLGSIYSLDFEQIEIKYQMLKDRLKERLEMDYNCNRCINRDRCGGGCAASAFILNGDILANDGQCRLKVLQTIKLELLQTLKERREQKNV